MSTLEGKKLINNIVQYLKPIQIKKKKCYLNAVTIIKSKKFIIT